MSIIQDKSYSNERALYALKDSTVLRCKFEGIEDGESVLKETRNIKVKESYFALRYPLWHAVNYEIRDTVFDTTSRASLWYSYKGNISNTKIRSVKAVRECKDITILNSDITSTEFGWLSEDIKLINNNIESEYFLFQSKNIEIDNLTFKGKYSFQYVINMNISNSFFDTKDAFWHSKNVVVRNTYIKGAYLGWFSEGLTLINCKIEGTQPLCYCKNLKLIDCEMINTDLAFEYSDVEATIKGNVLSIKNPRSGHIYVDSVDKIIKEEAVMTCTGEVIIRK